MADSPTDVLATGWRAVLRRTVREFRHDGVPDLAATLTYFGVLAIFPGLLEIGRASCRERV